MRLIYVDEAGTSAQEPFSIVAAIIVQADIQLRSAELSIDNVFDLHVPTQYRRNFHFHAKDLMTKKFDRDAWSFEQRHKFFIEFLQLPRFLKLPINLTKWSRQQWPVEILKMVQLKYSEQYDHVLAFRECLSSVNRFFVERLGREIGTIIAEDVPDIKRQLKIVQTILREDPTILTSDMVSWKEGEKVRNFSESSGNLIHCPNFVSKGEAPITQLADACAFAFRRFVSKKPHSLELMAAMLGEEQAAIMATDNRWFESSSSGTFFPPLELKHYPVMI